MEKPKSKSAVTFTFDERKDESLEKPTKGKKFGMPCTTRCGWFLREPALYTEAIIRNPDTGEERVLMVPRYEANEDQNPHNQKW